MKVTEQTTKIHMQEWANLIETRKDSGLSITISNVNVQFHAQKYL